MQKTGIDARKIAELHKISVIQIVQKEEHLKVIFANSNAKSLFKKKIITEEVILKSLHPKDRSLLTKRLMNSFLNTGVESIDEVRIKTQSESEHAIYKMSMCSGISKKEVVLQIHFQFVENISNPILGIIDFELVDLNSRFSPKTTEVTGIIIHRNSEAASTLQYGDRLIESRNLTIYDIIDEEYQDGFQEDVTELIVYKKPINDVVIKIVDRHKNKILIYGYLSIYTLNELLIGRLYFLDIMKILKRIILSGTEMEGKEYMLDIFDYIKRVV